MFDLCNFCRKLECFKVSPVFFRSLPKKCKKSECSSWEMFGVFFQYHPCRLAGSQATFLIESGDRLKRKELVRVSGPLTVKKSAPDEEIERSPSPRCFFLWFHGFKDLIVVVCCSICFIPSQFPKIQVFKDPRWSEIIMPKCRRFFCRKTWVVLWCHIWGVLQTQVTFVDG